MNTIIHLGISIVLLIYCCATVEGNDQVDISKIQKSVVIVETKSGIEAGAGSGFIIYLEGKYWMVSNEHVLRGGLPLKMRLLNGRSLTASGEIKVAQTQDLIAIGLAETDLDSVALSNKEPVINDKVFVVGNSDGSGVATFLEGKVVGVGPDEIEVDAQFVGGNSGSPVLDEKRNVLGVATYAVLDRDPEEWIKAGTRFEEVRRFAVRPMKVKWQEIQSKDYFVRADALNDLEVLVDDLFQIYAAGPSSSYRYSKASASRRYAGNKRMSVLASDIALARSAFVSARNEVINAAHAMREMVKSDYRDISSESILKMKKELEKQAYAKYCEAIDKMLAEVNALVEGNRWLVPRLERDASISLFIISKMSEVSMSIENPLLLDNYR